VDDWRSGIRLRAVTFNWQGIEPWEGQNEKNANSTMPYARHHEHGIDNSITNQCSSNTGISNRSGIANPD
jgi:hypothetical protein